MSTGGSVESLTLAGRTFSVTGDADITRKLGGKETETQANGDGTARDIKTAVPWMLSGCVVDTDDGREDQEFLQDISDSNQRVPVTMTMAGGDIYQGTGTINGELAFSSQNATSSFDLSGPGKLTKQ